MARAERGAYRRGFSGAGGIPEESACLVFIPLTQSSYPWSRSVRRDDPKTAASVYPIRLEIRVIHCKDCRQSLSLRNVDKSCIREIHRAIRILRHQCTKLREFGIVDLCHHDGARAYEAPRRLPFRLAVTHQVKQLGQHGFRGEQGQPELPERSRTELVPAIRSVEYCQNGTGIG